MSINPESKKERIKIKQRIDRLEAFCRQYPELWYVSTNKKKLEKYLSKIESEKEKNELLEKLEKAKEDHLYIRTRKSIGEKNGREIVSQEDSKRLREAGVLGGFGYPRYIEEIVNRYNDPNIKDLNKIEKQKKYIKKCLYEQIAMFGGLDNFRKKYIESLLNSEELDIPRDLKPLFIKSFDLSSPNFINMPYSEFMLDMSKIANKKEPILIFRSTDIRQEIGRLKQREEKVIELANGLDGKGKKNYTQIGKMMGVTSVAIADIEKRAYKRLLFRLRPNNLFKTYFDKEAADEFVKAYFDKYDIFAKEEELKKEDKKELLDVLGWNILKRDIRKIYGPVRFSKDDYKKIFDEINHHEYYLSYTIIPEEEREEIISKYWNDKKDQGDQEFLKKVTFYDVVKSKVYCEKENDYDRIDDLISTPIEKMEFSDSLMKKLKEEKIEIVGDIIYNYSQAKIIMNEELKESINSLGLKLALEKPKYKNQITKWKEKRDATGVEQLGISEESCEKLKDLDITTIGKLLQSEIKDENVYNELKTVFEKIDIGVDFELLQSDLKQRNNSDLGKILKMPISDLNLSARAWSSISRAGINTVEDFISMDKEGREKIRNFGQRSAIETYEALAKLGISYDEENDSFYFDDKQVEKFKYEEEIVEDEEEEKAKIEELDLSVRAYNCLAKAGIKNIEDVTKYTPGQIEEFRYFGPKTFEEIMEKIYAFGYKYDQENGWSYSPKPKVEEKSKDDKEEVLDEKEQIDKTLESRIEQLDQSYKILNQKYEKIQQLRTEIENRKKNLARIKEEKNGKVKEAEEEENIRKLEEELKKELNDMEL